MPGADHDPVLFDITHPRFQMVDPTIFTRTMVADCLTHGCRIRSTDTAQSDACCQYGADTDLAERDKILQHADELRALLTPEAAAADWFTGDLYIDTDFPSGKHTRTAVLGHGCVFLHHDKRGCAIHRASVEGGWDFSGIKPNICRLYPLTYDYDSIVIAEDYEDYSCAFDPTAPSLYRVARDTLAAIFGDELVAVLDAAESQVLAALPRRLPVV